MCRPATHKHTNIRSESTLLFLRILRFWSMVINIVAPRETTLASSMVVEKCRRTLWRCTSIKQMNTQSSRLETRVYEAWDSLMVVMKECKAPGGCRRGSCEQKPWQRWIEFTGQHQPICTERCGEGESPCDSRWWNARELCPSWNNRITDVGMTAERRRAGLKAPVPERRRKIKPSHRI